MSSAYLRLLIFLLAILIPAYASSSSAFLMMYSAYKLNKHGDNIQPWHTPLSIFEPVRCSVSSSSCGFLTCIQVSQEASKVKVKVKSLSRVRLFVTPWTIAHQAPPSKGFSRQEYWSGLPFHSPRDLPDPGIKPRSPTLQADALTSEPPGKPMPLIKPLIIIEWRWLIDSRD